MPLDDEILGHGVYTPKEAARLLGTSSQQILRWTRGSGPNDPLWNGYYQFLDEDVSEISFLDLIEVRVVLALRNAGVSLQAIRFAISFAQDKYSIQRPLASQFFKTDGREILMEALERDGDLVSLSKMRPGQKVFSRIVAQSLNDLEYENERVVRWRPRNHEKVVIDPHRYFGDPILDDFGLSTGMIYKEFSEFGDINYLASIYEVPISIIRSGIEFERSLDEADG